MDIIVNISLNLYSLALQKTVYSYMMFKCQENTSAAVLATTLIILHSKTKIPTSEMKLNKNVTRLYNWDFLES